jgi:hypothetical protein
MPVPAPPHPNAPAVVPVPVARADDHGSRCDHHGRRCHHRGRDDGDGPWWRGDHTSGQRQQTTEPDNNGQDATFHCSTSGQPTPTYNRIKARTRARGQASTRAVASQGDPAECPRERHTSERRPLPCIGLRHSRGFRSRVPRQAQQGVPHEIGMRTRRWARPSHNIFRGLTIHADYRTRVQRPSDQRVVD